MTKDEILKLNLAARRAIQANDWDRAIEAVDRYRVGLCERRETARRASGATNVRIRKGATGYDVYMGGVKRGGTMGENESLNFAAELMAKYGGKLVETPW